MGRDRQPAIAAKSGTHRRGANLRILLVGINYEPELAGIGPYTTGLAKHFASEGHAVTVVTGVPHYPQWKRLPYAKSNPQDNPRVHRYNHFIPKRPRALGRSLYEFTWLLSAFRAVPDAEFDVVIGVVPSLSGAILAWKIARRQRIPFGIIFQDLMGSAALQSGYTGGPRLAALVGSVELSLARRAAGVAIVAEGFRPYLESGGVASSKIARVRNWAGGFAPTVARDAMRRRLNWEPGAFVCLHAGNMGQKQALDNLLEAARLLEGKGVTIVLAGDGNDRARLVAKARSFNLTNVRFVGVQPSGKYESMLQAADLLVLNQRSSVSDMALPSKLSSYFAAGRPVLAAVAGDSEAARELRASGAAVVVPPQNPEELAGSLLRLQSAGNEALMALGTRGIQYADQHLSARSAFISYTGFIHSLASAEGYAPLPAEDSRGVGGVADRGIVLAAPKSKGEMNS